MKCQAPECSGVLSPADKLCQTCGLKRPAENQLTLKCPSCGTTVELKTKFCGECGTKINPSLLQAKVQLCGGTNDDGSPCGAELVPGKPFCVNCGAKTDSAVPTKTTGATAIVIQKTVDINKENKDIFGSSSQSDNSGPPKGDQHSGENTHIPESTETPALSNSDETPNLETASQPTDDDSKRDVVTSSPPDDSTTQENDKQETVLVEGTNGSINDNEKKQNKSASPSGAASVGYTSVETITELFANKLSVDDDDKEQNDEPAQACQPSDPDVPQPDFDGSSVAEDNTPDGLLHAPVPCSDVGTENLDKTASATTDADGNGNKEHGAAEQVNTAWPSNFAGYADKPFQDKEINSVSSQMLNNHASETDNSRDIQGQTKKDVENVQNPSEQVHPLKAELNEAVRNETARSDKGNGGAKDISQRQHDHKDQMLSEEKTSNSSGQQETQQRQKSDKETDNQKKRETGQQTVDQDVNDKKNDKGDPDVSPSSQNQDGKNTSNTKEKSYAEVTASPKGQDPNTKGKPRHGGSGRAPQMHGTENVVVAFYAIVSNLWEKMDPEMCQFCIRFAPHQLGTWSPLEDKHVMQFMKKTSQGFLYGGKVTMPKSLRDGQAFYYKYIVNRYSRKLNAIEHIYERVQKSEPAVDIVNRSFSFPVEKRGYTD